MFFYGDYYYLIVALQAFCVFHCVRRNNQNKWIWIIVCLPGIGSLIYLFSEVIDKRSFGNVQSNLGSVINPGGRIKTLEKKLKFSDSFDNRVALADAYLRSGSTDRAIELYESSLTGIFMDNEYVIIRLIIAYFEKERYVDVIRLAERVVNSFEFAKSHAHMLYALSLERTGEIAKAENEFKTMTGRFSNYEARFNYALFLSRNGRKQAAGELLSELLSESEH